MAKRTDSAACERMGSCQQVRYELLISHSLLFAAGKRRRDTTVGVMLTGTIAPRAMLTLANAFLQLQGCSSQSK